MGLLPPPPHTTLSLGRSCRVKSSTRAWLLWRSVRGILCIVCARKMLEGKIALVWVHPSGYREHRAPGSCQKAACTGTLTPASLGKSVHVDGGPLKDEQAVRYTYTITSSCSASPWGWGFINTRVIRNTSAFVPVLASEQCKGGRLLQAEQLQGCLIAWTSFQDQELLPTGPNQLHTLQETQKTL